MAAVDPEELAEVRPYVDLARRLGLLHAQLAHGAIRKASLTYKGDLAGKKTRLLTAAFTAGLLEYRLSAGVNLVNAEMLARERGIEIAESSNPKKGRLRRRSCTPRSRPSRGRRSRPGRSSATSTCGSCNSGRTEWRVTSTACCWSFTHRDVPGMIGFVGTIFGNPQVNIAQMTVGRQAPGGEAIGILNLDSPPPEAAVNAVKAHPQISNVTVVKLPAAGELPGWLA